MPNPEASSGGNEANVNSWTTSMESFSVPTNVNVEFVAPTPVAETNEPSAAPVAEADPATNETAESAETREISEAEYNKIVASFTHIADYYKYQNEIGLSQEELEHGIVGMDEWAPETTAKYLELVKNGGSRVNYEERARKYMESQGLTYGPDAEKVKAERMNQLQERLAAVSDSIGDDEGVNSHIAELIRNGDADGLESLIAEAEARAATPVAEAPIEAPAEAATAEETTEEPTEELNELGVPNILTPEESGAGNAENGSERFERFKNIFRTWGKRVAVVGLALGLVAGGFGLSKRAAKNSEKPVTATTATESIDAGLAYDQQDATDDKGAENSSESNSESGSERGEAMERVGSHLGRFASEDGTTYNHEKQLPNDFDAFSKRVGEFGHENLSDDEIKDELFKNATQLDATLAGNVLRAMDAGISFDGLTPGMSDDELQKAISENPDLKKSVVERMDQIFSEGTLSRDYVSGTVYNEYAVSYNFDYANPDSYDCVQCRTVENNSPVYVINFDGTDMMWKYMCSQPITYVEVPGVPEVTTTVVTTTPVETTTTTPVETTTTTPVETTTTTPVETTTTTPVETTTTTPVETTTTTPVETTTTTPVETTTTTPVETTTTTPVETTTTTEVTTTNLPKNTEAEADAAGQAPQEYVTEPVITEPVHDGEGYYDPNTGTWVMPGEEPGVSFENIGGNGQGEAADISDYETEDASGQTNQGDYDTEAATARAEQAEEAKERQDAANNSEVNTGERIDPVAPPNEDYTGVYDPNDDL